MLLSHLSKNLGRTVAAAKEVRSKYKRKREKKVLINLVLFLWTVSSRDVNH